MTKLAEDISSRLGWRGFRVIIAADNPGCCEFVCAKTTREVNDCLKGIAHVERVVLTCLAGRDAAIYRVVSTP